MAEGIGSDPRRNGAPGGGKGMVGELALLGFLVALVPFVVAGTVFWGIYAAACLTGLAGNCLNVSPTGFDPSGGGTRFNGDCKPAEELIGTAGEDALRNFRQYLPVIEKEAARRGLPVGLIAMQILQESGYNPNVTSSAGAGGFIQLMPDTYAELDRDNRALFLQEYPGKPTGQYDPEYNIFLGVTYLKKQHDFTRTHQKQPYDLALAAYNAGPGNVERFGFVVPPFQETQDYVKVILENWTKVQACEEQRSQPGSTAASSERGTAIAEAARKAIGTPSSKYYAADINNACAAFTSSMINPVTDLRLDYFAPNHWKGSSGTIVTNMDQLQPGDEVFWTDDRIGKGIAAFDGNPTAAYKKGEHVPMHVGIYIGNYEGPNGRGQQVKLVNAVANNSGENAQIVVDPANAHPLYDFMGAKRY
ncbi:MAG: lytic transglycosylase domain-containing protein [Patescibacteria group bacterium]|jgi:cell wall-associated NlpC family hydrolase